VQELPEDGTLVSKHFGMIKVCTIYMLYVHLIAVLKENKSIKMHGVSGFKNVPQNFGKKYRATYTWNSPLCSFIQSSVIFCLGGLNTIILKLIFKKWDWGGGHGLD
jgi:hypothetical protein